METTGTPKVGDRIGYRTFTGQRRVIIVDEVSEDIKNGRPGFGGVDYYVIAEMTNWHDVQAHLRAGGRIWDLDLAPEQFARLDEACCWGYTDQIS